MALEKQQVPGKNRFRTTSLDALSFLSELIFVKISFSGVLASQSRKMTSLENYIRNLRKSVVFKVASYLPLRLNVDSVRQASLRLKIKCGLIDHL